MTRFSLLCLPLLAATGSSLAPLCEPPTPDQDDQFISCEIEASNVSEGTDPLDTKLTVVEYNIDRNGGGGDGPNEAGMDPITALLSNTDLLPPFDVLFMSEVARGCDAWGGVSGTAEIASHWNYNYAYAVEYVEVGATR